MTQINLNVAPYHDDYQDSKNFHRILFQPGVSVQARELTQMQTILQKQIERFGRHVLKEGSLVLGGAYDLEVGIDIVKIETPLSLAVFDGQEIVGSVSGLKAYVRSAVVDSSNGHSVLFVRYTNQGLNGETSFLASETLSLVNDTFTTATVLGLDHVGKGTLFGISEGVLFTKGFFVMFPSQKIPVSLYSSTPNETVGFEVSQAVVTAEEDLSLLDNAQGTTNYAAPGADRFVITLSLKLRSQLLNIDSTNFAELVVIQNGVVAQTNERSQYSRIYEELAKRTYDESGDYYVRGLGVIVREHLNDGENEGLLTLEDGGDPDMLAVGVEPGVAYVKGYEVNKLVTEYISVPKSQEYQSVNNNILTFRTGGYLRLTQVTGSPDADVGSTVSLRDTLGNRITSNASLATALPGNQIGTAVVKGIELESGVAGTASAIYRLYLINVTMNVGTSFSSVRAVGVTNKFSADVAEPANVRLIDSNVSHMFVPVGNSFIRSVLDDEGNSDTSFFFNRTETKTANISSPNQGTFEVTVTNSSERIAYGDGPLTAAEKAQFIVYADENKVFQLPGTVAYTSGASTLTGTSTFFTRLHAGARVQVNGNYYLINNITDDNNASIVGTFGSSSSGQTISRAYLKGDIIDLTVKGSSGTDRVVTADTSLNTLTFDLKEDTSLAAGSFSVRVTYRVNRFSAKPIRKLLRKNVLVKFDCSTLASLSEPLNLGLPDVYKINSIRKHTAAFVTGAEGSDITASFYLDNGQRDNSYEHARLVNRGAALLATDFILVDLDVFEPDLSQGVGFFCVDSYPIDDTGVNPNAIQTYDIPSYTTAAGSTFDLRDVLDFRFIRSATASYATTVVGATTNPTVGTSWSSVAGGIRLPVASSQLFADYTYYLARRDVITLSSDGTIGVVQGTPGEFPVTPVAPDTVMALANVFVPPYPSISIALSRILNQRERSVQVTRVSHVRHTMRDIGVIKQRVDNLEYYNALSLLEKRVVDLKVLDENGLDRFKNGFFVDGFLDHSLGATDNEDYSIVVDKSEQVIRPRFTMDSYGFNVKSLSGAVQTGNLITLPYTETALVEQTNVTTTRNIEQSVFRFIGTLSMNPDVDTWVDTTTYDKTVNVGDHDVKIGDMTTTWGAWSDYITGFALYEQGQKWTGKQWIPGTLDPNAKEMGTFKSFAEAEAAAKRSGRWDVWRTYASGFGGAIVQDATSTRQGIKTTVTSISSSIQQMGSFLTDVSVVPYIRPQDIVITARGVKANTRFHVFFDGENVNDYCVPLLTDGEIADLQAQGLSIPTMLPPAGTPARSDRYGEVKVALVLPSSGKRFRIGTKEVILTDSPTNAVDATTYAKGTFVASGLNATKQNTILSTKIPRYEQETVTESKKKVQSVKIMGPSCMAYSFFVDVPESVEGVFLTSVDVFVESMHPTLGMWFEIREMDSAGGITRNQVPYSEVWMKRNDPRIQLWNGQGTPVATKVNFPSPVYLLNDTQYAFVIHTEGLNPDTYFWVSRLGETDLLTGEPVVGRQLKGTLYTTNNNLNYDMVQDVDMMIRFNRANFNTGSVGVASLGNKPIEFVNTEPFALNPLLAGDTVTGDNMIRLTITDGTGVVEVGDELVFTQGTFTVESINGPWHYLSGRGIELNDEFEIVTKELLGVVTQVEQGSAEIRSVNGDEYKLELINSNGRFFVGSNITGTRTNFASVITEVNDHEFSTIQLKPHSMTPAGTVLSYSTFAHDVALGDYQSIVGAPADASLDFPTEVVILSRSNEIANSLDASVLVDVGMSTTNAYVSPVIDMSLANAVYVHNLINNDATNEDQPENGALWNKYISRIVTLAEGQDAEDLIVTLTSFRPPNSDVRVWAKLQHAEDQGVTFDELPWIEMTKAESVFSSPGNKGDFKEFSYSLPSSSLNNGVFFYNNDRGNFSGFKRFSVKIGLMGTNSALVPRVGDLRAIALQK